jgi:(p)ppGpp synthase/HD superfamily hydrolase
MKQSPTLQDAITLARQAHAGQVDKAGAPYIEHPLRMVDTLDDTEGKIVAVLHDVVEDTEVTLDDLRKAGYSPEVVAAVDGLTRRVEETYEEFIRRAATDPLARQVKIADLRDNMNLARIAEPTVRDYERLKRYERALQVLEGEE